MHVEDEMSCTLREEGFLKEKNEFFLLWSFMDIFEMKLLFEYMMKVKISLCVEKKNENKKLSYIQIKIIK